MRPSTFRFRSDFGFGDVDAVELFLEFHARGNSIRALPVVNEQHAETPIDQTNVLKQLRPRLRRRDRRASPSRRVAPVTRRECAIRRPSARASRSA